MKLVLDAWKSLVTMNIHADLGIDVRTHRSNLAEPPVMVDFQQIACGDVALRAFDRGDVVEAVGFGDFEESVAFADDVLPM